MYKIALIFFVVLLFETAHGQDDYKAQRELMVDKQLIPRNIYDTKTLKAMREVKRHEFVPEAMKPYAYQDSPLSIFIRL